MNIEKLKEVFKKYVEKYDMTDKNIIRKFYHSYRVMDLCMMLADDNNFNKEDMEIAILIGLLHDYARFEQWTKFGTYNDLISIDHGDLAVKKLFDEYAVLSADFPVQVGFQRLNLLQHGVDGIFGFLLGRTLRGNSQRTAAVGSIGCKRGIGLLVDQRKQFGFQRRFPNAKGLNHPIMDAVVGALFQIGQCALVEHRLHFKRRAGQADDDFSVFLQRKTGCGAAMVVKDGSPGRHIGLLAVVFRHNRIVFPESFFQRVHAGLMQNQFIVQGLAGDFLGHVVLCRAKTTGGDDQVAVFEGELNHVFQSFRVIADSIVIHHVDAQQIQLLREKYCVGVGNLPE